MSRITIICMCLVSAAAAPALAQQVTGDVVAAGFGATNTTGHVARKGQWIPILCNLRAQLDYFQGALSCEAVDLDGDRVAFTTSLMLTAGGSKRVWLYVSSPGDPPSEVKVFSEDGTPIAVSLKLPEIEYIKNDTMLVLDISARSAGLSLQTPGIFRGDAPNDRPYYRGIVVSHMAAKRLPDRWWGLEAVNVIVWDKPNPADLNVAQMTALIDWVRNGGQLVMGLGEAWSQVRDSRLAEILPLEGTQPVGVTQQLNSVRPETLFTRKALEFNDPIAICTAKRVRGTTIAGARLPGGKWVELIVSEAVGSGRVMTITTGIADLMKMEPNLTPEERGLLLKAFFDLNEMQSEWIQLEEQTFRGERTQPLFGAITDAIGFVSKARVLRIAAIGFVVAYILLSTFATWWWLKKRSLTQMSWTAFAACAVAASFLSLATVGMSRGFAKVDAVTIYDMQVDSRQARGPCWFGYRSPTSSRVELTLPGDQNYLRALSLADQTPYATPERYTAFASQAKLSNTLMRASLKQFEGFWVGELDGVVRAQLQVERSTGRISPLSWIANELPVNITGGWLLYMDPRLPDSAPNKPAGYEPNPPKIPAHNVLLVEIGPLSVSERTTPLGAREAAAADKALRDWQALSNRQPPAPDLLTLRDGHVGWMKTVGATVFVTADQRFRDAVMLASTRNLHLHLNKNLKGMDAIIGTEGLIDLDVTHWLSKDQGVLILFSNEPGPATLVRDGSEMNSESGYSVYRVRVPITRKGRRSVGAGRGGDQP